MADDDSTETTSAPAYPPFVTTQDQRRRWDFCRQAAEGLFGDLPQDEQRAQVWSATRALYSSDIPTDAPGEPTKVAATS